MLTIQWNTDDTDLTDLNGLVKKPKSTVCYTFKAIAKNKYTQMAQDFCSSATTAWMQEVEHQQ
ncbi:MAG: hypothetical protein EPN17_14130 [Methylobacter sp.]|nr:MAG: hypothetical protein EPN17_14130 [Methylobacter sp.]